MAESAVTTVPVSTEEAQQWAEGWVERWNKLAQEIIHSHPFMTKLQKGQLTREGVRQFTENWYQWVRTIGMSGAGLYHRHLTVFKHHPDLDAHVLDRIAQELVRPVKAGHGRALEALFPALGIESVQRQIPNLIPEMTGFIAFIRRLHLEGTFAEVHSCQFGPNIAAFARSWVDALTKHHGVPPDATLYWRDYCDFNTRSTGGGILGTRQENLYVLRRIKELGLVEERPGWGMEYTAEMSLRMWELFLKGCNKAFS